MYWRNGSPEADWLVLSEFDITLAPGLLPLLLVQNSCPSLQERVRFLLGFVDIKSVRIRRRRVPENTWGIIGEDLVTC